MKKISDLKQIITINRPTRDQFGNRYTEELDFEIPYNPTIKEPLIRLGAKFIDIIICAIWALIICLFIGYNADWFDLFLMGMLIVVLLNPLLETNFGKSVGKWVWKIQVINDYGKQPDYLTSYKRNFLSLPGFLIAFRRLSTKNHIRLNYHNEACKTYTIFDKDKDLIINKLNAEIDLIGKT